MVAGVVPRAAAALFDKLIPQNFGPNGAGSIPMSSSMSQLKTPRAYGQQSLLGDRNWSLKATYVEIYNEQLRDLLVPEATPAHERTNIAIREDAKGNILLTGLRQVDINSVDDLLNALHFGSTIRQTDATAINAKSSRSHAVFSLNLIQRKTKLQTATGREKRFSVPLEAMTGQDMAVTTDSKLHFVDLAGSERLKNTGAQGERAKEGISINAGLASLGKVISQLSSRQSGSHVSYRDSKLTRLLQDSLGGNAITYMIACVTPAEFHLSETLNTVQYAQRARAIQSKPRIQQIDEAGDSKALIERLRAEVAFLREQIHSSQARSGSPRRGNGTAGDRTDRHNERESELQNQLLDSQENYNALSQRHAKLIAELARARETESENAGEVDMASDSATDRLNRSNSFAQAVEQVVLEYEKTIETLEQSLTSTRSTLSNSETVLLEKETRCAYVETINTQLQTRVQKLMDRESNTESYLHDLEAKLDGHTTGDEKNATVMTELRKELARIRENEAASEDYISTLEERLAEADQDAELMQREIDRLEQVVERQRSLGKLDALLHELDNVDQGRSPIADSREPNGIAPGSSTGHGRTMSHMSRKSQFDEPIPEEAEDVGDGTAELKITEAEETTAADGDVEDATATPSVADDSNGDLPRQSPAQSKFVADKLENVTQELIDLRVEHESTVTDYDHLQAKYEDAMKNLAELQDAVDEARHGDSAARNRDSVASGPSDAENTRDSYSTGTKSKDGPRSSMSRSLSSELSSAMESPATVDTSTADMESDDETATTKPTESSEDLSQQASNEQELAAEIRRLRKLADDKEAAEKNLADKYAELEETHSETLDIVEELKTEVSKARAVEATSPRQSTPVIRRKSSQNLMIIDRAHRSFASLRNIASENFEQNPEVMQNFELNLNSAMHELHSRSERIQELEADITSVKKEMETKMTIISGLTRERSSLKASPMDISMVANLRGQLEQNEKQLAVMRATHAAREEELTGELVKVREALGDGATPTPETGNDVTQEREHKISDLEAQLAVWENKHNQATTAAEENEQSLRDTIQQLEAKVAATEASMASSTAMAKSSDDEAARETEKKQKALAEFLRSEIDEYKAIINSNTAKIAELDKTHSAAKARLGALTETHESATKQLTEHQELVASLESKIADHATAMEALKTGHAKELAGLKADEQNSYEEQAGVLMQEHTEATHKLEAELAAAREQLDKVAAQVGEGMGIDVGVDQLSEQIARLLADQKALVEEQRKAEELKSHVAELTSINETMVTDAETTKSTLAEMLSGSNEAVPGTVALQLASVKRRLDDLDGRNKKNSRLVEELEEQLQNNFDEAQVTNNRLSTLQSERNSQLDDAVAVRTRLQSDLDSIREEYSSLQVSHSIRPAPLLY